VRVVILANQMIKRKVQISFSIEIEDYVKLAEMSRKTGRTVSAIVRDAVKKYLGGGED